MPDEFQQLTPIDVLALEIAAGDPVGVRRVFSITQEVCNRFVFGHHDRPDTPQYSSAALPDIRNMAPAYTGVQENRSFRFAERQESFRIFPIPASLMPNGILIPMGSRIKHLPKR